MAFARVGAAFFERAVSRKGGRTNRQSLAYQTAAAPGQETRRQTQSAGATEKEADDRAATPAQIIEWVVLRWSVETTFEDARAHLGLETQRQGSDRAIVRTTPCLLGLFSRVVLLTQRLQPDGQVPVLTAAWYQKPEATFSDCLVLVRKHLWRSLYPVNSAEKAESISFPASAWEHWLSCLAVAA